MDFFLLFGLVVVFFLFFNHIQSKKLKKKRKSYIHQDQLDSEEWHKEFRLGTTELTFRDWKIAKAQSAANAYVERQQVLFEEMVNLGIKLKDVKRKGASRKIGGHFLNPTESDSIHPLEVKLIEREKRALDLLGYGHGPVSHKSAYTNDAKLTKEEINSLHAELKTLDNEWSALNIHFLDEYYAEHIKDVTREDFSLMFHPPQDTARFPYSAGQWSAKSKRWGFIAYKGAAVTPIFASAVSKNLAIVLAQENIESRKKKQKDVVPVPLDPMDADL